MSDREEHLKLDHNARDVDNSAPFAPESQFFLIIWLPVRLVWRRQPLSM
jgi:hypothetical protein